MALLLMTLNEVAKELRCDYETVRGFVNSGQLKAVRLGGRRKFGVRPAALEAFLSDSEFVPQTVPELPRKRQEMSRKRPGQKAAGSQKSPETPWYLKVRRA